VKILKKDAILIEGSQGTLFPSIRKYSWVV